MKSIKAEVEDQAIKYIEKELNKNGNLNSLTADQKLCMLLSKNLNPYGNTVIGSNVTIYFEKLLRDGANVNYIDEYNKTPLDIALSYKNVTSVLWLVDHGVQGYHSLGASEKLCLLLSTKHSIYDNIFEQHLNGLLQNGADINYVDRYGKTPLKIAIDQGNAVTALWLAQHGAKVCTNGLAFFSCQFKNHLVTSPHDPLIIHNEFFKQLVKYCADTEFPKFLNIALNMKKLQTYFALIRYENIVSKFSSASDLFDTTKPKTLSNIKASNILNKVKAGELENYFFYWKLSILCQREIENNLESCTIHKFVLFEHLKSVPDFFTESLLAKISGVTQRKLLNIYFCNQFKSDSDPLFLDDKAALVKQVGTSALELLRVCKSPASFTEGKESVNKSNGLWSLPNDITAYTMTQFFDFSEWFKVIGVSGWFDNALEA